MAMCKHQRELEYGGFSRRRRFKSCFEATGFWSPPILMSDVEAETFAAESREQGAALVRRHLENHSRNNPGRSSDYVTWIATLHPENADVVIDNRFLIPGNPWWKIYEQCKNELPSAIAVPVEQVELAPANNQEQVPTHWLCLCSPIELVVTFTIMSVTFPVILVCEIVGLCFYLPAFVLYWMAKPLDPPNAFTGIFYSFLMVLYYTFMICDSACLLSSVCVAESFAIVCWLSSLLFGGIWTANNRHQYIRRNCHLTRWAFRAPISQPPRHLCTCFFRANEDVLFTDPTTATELNYQTEAKQDSATVVTHVQVDAFQ